MNNDETFFNTLADFRDVRPGNHHDFASISKDSSMSSHSHEAKDFGIDLNSNEKLLKNFKELR